MAREGWTDEQLDDLNRRVENGFKEVDQRFKEVDQRFDHVDERFDGVDKRLEKLEDRFASLQLTLLVVGGGLMGTSFVCSAAIVATQL